jgi:hypothetical protein
MRKFVIITVDSILEVAQVQQGLSHLFSFMAILDSDSRRPFQELGQLWADDLFLEILPNPRILPAIIPPTRHRSMRMDRAVQLGAIHVDTIPIRSLGNKVRTGKVPLDNALLYILL